MEHPLPNRSNKKFTTRLLILLLFFHVSWGGLVGLMAQSFPVQIIPLVVPPPPIYFSDYANTDTMSGALRVQVILNDFKITDREIRLRVYFEGNGINFH
ncbi:MAG TPA: hypothetical protein VLZ54_09500, partial [Arenibacter sp.]|nr:hypothetical protein [Arenibacter sp.]